MLALPPAIPYNKINNYVMNGGILYDKNLQCKNFFGSRSDHR